MVIKRVSTSITLSDREKHRLKRYGKRLSKQIGEDLRALELLEYMAIQMPKMRINEALEMVRIVVDENLDISEIEKRVKCQM